MYTREEKIKLLDKINKRIRRVESKFNFDTKTKEIWRQQLEDIVPNTDMITKTGLLSVSEKSLANIDDNVFRTLEANIPESISDLKQNAKESLEESGIFEGEVITSEDIAREVGATIRLSNTFSEAVNQWYDFRDSLDPIFWSDSRVIELETMLYEKGQKSYSELEHWMNLAESVINNINRRNNYGN